MYYMYTNSLVFSVSGLGLWSGNGLGTLGLGQVVGELLERYLAQLCICPEVRGQVGERLGDSTKRCLSCMCVGENVEKL